MSASTLMLVAETALCLMFQYVSEHDDVTF